MPLFRRIKNGGQLEPAIVQGIGKPPVTIESDYTSSPATKGSTPADVVAGVGSVAGAGLSTVNPLIGMAVSAGTQLLAQHLQNKYTDSANRQARAWSLEDRVHEEFYNSPVMQKLRALEAGLSPAEYVSGVATQTNTPTPQAPDMSFLSQAGSSGIEGLLNMQTYNDNMAVARSRVKLLEAQAEEAYQSARTAKDRYDLEVASKKFELSYQGKQLQLIDKQIAGSDLDNEAKVLANQWSKDTRDLNYKLLAGQVEGIELSNDMQKINIRGREYEVDNILPEEFKHLKNQNKLDEKQLVMLGLQLGILEKDALLAKAEYKSIVDNYERIENTFSMQYKVSEQEAKVALRFALTNYWLENAPGMKQLFGVIGNLLRGLLS